MSAESRTFAAPPALQVPNPKLLWRTGRAIRERQTTFFGEAIVGRNYSGYLNIIRNALEVVEFVPELEEFEERYSKWHSMDNDAIVQAGLDGEALTNDQMRALAERNDPAMYVISVCENIRPTMPNIHLRRHVEHEIFTVYGILGTSVHQGHDI